MRKYFLNIQKVWFLLLLTVQYSPIYAQNSSAANTYEIVTVMSADYNEYRESLNEFQTVLEKHDIDFNIRLDVGKRTDNNIDPRIINRIQEDRPDLILALGTKAAQSLSTHIHDIPIVFSMVLNPLYTNSSNNNNSNITGVTLSVPVLTQFSVLKRVIPELYNIGVIYSHDENETLINEARIAATGLNINLVPIDVNDERDVPSAVQNLIRVVDIIWLIVDKAVNSEESRKHIILTGHKNNIPVVGPSKNYVSAGAAFAISTDYTNIGAQSAGLAIEILNGVNPSQIPHESPSNVILYVNERIHDWFGIPIPENSVRQRLVIIK